MKTPSLRNRKGAEQARQELPAILAAAAAGRSTLITRHGRPIYRSRGSACHGQGCSPAPLTMLAGTGHGLWGERSARTLARLRDEWKR